MVKSSLKSRQYFRKKPKYTQAHKKRRRTKSRHRNKARSNNKCDKNKTVKREPACDEQEGDIEMDKIKKGKGYCSGKYCISEDTIESIRAADKNNRYKDPWTRKDLTNAYLIASLLKLKKAIQL